MNFTKEELKQWIEDYHWMVESIKLNAVGSTVNISASISKYGDKMIISKGQVGNPVLNKVLKMERYRDTNIERQKKIIRKVNELTCLIKQERDQYTLKRLLEGATLSDIAREVELSITSIVRSRERVLRDMIGGK